jgi:glutamine synthetase
MDTVNTAGKSALDFMRELDQRGKIIAEYIWLDGDLGMRSKTRTLAQKVESLD